MTLRLLSFFLIVIFFTSSVFAQSRNKKSSIDYIYFGTDIDLTRVNRPYAPNGAIGIKVVNSSKRYLGFEVNGWSATQEERENVGSQVSIKGEERILSINGLVKFGFNLTKTVKKGLNAALFTGFNYWRSDTESFTSLNYPVNSNAYNLVVGVEPEYILNLTKKIGVTFSLPISLATIGLEHKVINDPTRPIEENTTDTFRIKGFPQFSIFRLSLQMRL